jgi:uncharacterized protein YebE (UPF0316 family)
MTDLFAGLWGPFIIFGLRIIDVSLATLRMLLTMRNARKVVPLIGFFESLIWVVAVGTAIQNLHSIWHILGYSGGFATGTLVGLWLEGKLAVGLATVRIITRTSGEEVAEALRDGGSASPSSRGTAGGGGWLIYTLVKRRQIDSVLAEVERMDPGGLHLGGGAPDHAPGVDVPHAAEVGPGGRQGELAPSPDAPPGVPRRRRAAAPHRRSAGRGPAPPRPSSTPSSSTSRWRTARMRVGPKGTIPTPCRAGAPPGAPGECMPVPDTSIITTLVSGAVTRMPGRKATASARRRARAWSSARRPGGAPGRGARQRRGFRPGASVRRAGAGSATPGPRRRARPAWSPPGRRAPSRGRS